MIMMRVIHLEARWEIRRKTFWIGAASWENLELFYSNGGTPLAVPISLTRIITHIRPRILKLSCRSFTY